MKVIIAGPRNIAHTEKNYYKLAEFLTRWQNENGKITEVVSGTCCRRRDGKPKGIDLLGELWANKRGIPVTQFPAEWKVWGKAAGPVRNRQMAEYGDALVVLRHDVTKGTMNMIRTAAEEYLLVNIYEESDLDLDEE